MRHGSKRLSGHIVRKQMPVVLASSEVARVLSLMQGTPRLIGGLLYGSGLRVMEALTLRVKDIDFVRNDILVRNAKGQKDRHTVLPESLKDELRKHLESVRQLQKSDLSKGFGRAPLRDALSVKYPNADRSWSWQWVFPASSRYYDREARTERRHHIHELVVQKAMKQAVEAAGITKPASCHSLRHSFATHTCSKAGMISAPFKSSSGTLMSGQLRFTHTFLIALTPSAAPSTGSPTKPASLGFSPPPWALDFLAAGMP